VSEISFAPALRNLGGNETSNLCSRPWSGIAEDRSVARAGRQFPAELAAVDWNAQRRGIGFCVSNRSTCSLHSPAGGALANRTRW